MRQQADVEIVAGGNSHTTTFEANVLAVDDALVEMARQQLDVSVEEFDTGRVVES
jgi:hypothetical protein